jgi:hypothetical protein
MHTSKLPLENYTKKTSLRKLPEEPKKVPIPKLSQYPSKHSPTCPQGQSAERTIHSKIWAATSAAESLDRRSGFRQDAGLHIAALRLIQTLVQVHRRQARQRWIVFQIAEEETRPEERTVLELLMVRQCCDGLCDMSRALRDL